ncbi:FAD-dependent oxidoreductase [Solimonas sp. K1W22B-7]|uniref:FAD-dependent oxidoreductase n=1 Tax=Solimonas sp. K1W22B-7 TaxID=2303331 RepID=UPI000E32F2A4|nr:FAD-dependent oxidoreductase [Solimonas sp. K1W22B-7]AXQ28877.1 FAD-dependent oxidoreductase [Solimonas sp. K1W22B-7]
MDQRLPLTRRQVLAAAGATAVSTSVGAGLLPPLNRTYDVIVVGGGGAGLSAALGAKRADPKASVLLLEAKITPGGTSFRSGGRVWVPNNADMRAAGLNDPRDMALRYMARLSHPDRYNPAAPLLGLEPRHHAQLGAYYDSGADMLDWYRSTGIMPWEAERGAQLPIANDPLDLNGVFAPDYHPELEENVPKRGRSIIPRHFDPTLLTTTGSNIAIPNYGASIAGIDLIAWLQYGCLVRGVTMLPSHRVTDIKLRHVGARMQVEGVRVRAEAEGLGLLPEMEYKARRGVIFASGGYSKNAQRLAANFQGDRAFSGGGCAVTSAKGDLVDMAERYGFQLENMGQAWYIQNLYEQYKLDPDSLAIPNYLLFQAYWPNGDSMIMVNRKGRRVVNEKTNYHDRTQVHFQPDNRFLVSIFDTHTLTRFAGVGGHVTPLANTLIGPAATPEALRKAILARFNRDPQTKAFGLSADFATQLDATLARFNGFAQSGVDTDFRRGEQPIDIWWHTFCLTFQGVNAGPVKDCISANVDENGQRYPNPTMRPLKPPYFAVILSSGLQDTNGGPAIDEHGRILDTAGQPVEGLYGAGNCIASPAGKGYWGAGGTLGPAVVFGHIAGRHAASRV